MGESRDFIAFIAENANEQANLGEIQKKILRLSRMLGRFHLEEVRKNFRNLARPVFAEILSWEEQGEEEPVYTLVVRLKDYEPEPVPILQYIAIALFIGFQIGYLMKNQLSVENALREKALRPEHQPICIENTKELFRSHKIDFFEISFLIFCLLFFVISFMENKTFFVLRLKLTVKTFKEWLEKRKKENSSLLPLKPSSLIFEIYG